MNLSAYVANSPVRFGDPLDRPVTIQRHGPGQFDNGRQWVIAQPVRVGSPILKMTRTGGIGICKTRTPGTKNVFQDPSRHTFGVPLLVIAVLLLFAFVRWNALTTNAQTISSPATQESPVTVRGRVVEAGTGSAVEGATVTTEPTIATIGRTIVTDVNGNFILRDVPAGDYQIVVTHQGYSPGGYGQLWPGAPRRPLRLVDSKVSAVPTFSSTLPNAIGHGAPRSS